MVNCFDSYENYAIDLARGRFDYKDKFFFFYQQNFFANFEMLYL